MTSKLVAMKYVRRITIYGDYFADFYDNQTLSVQRKINYVLNLIRVEEKIPSKFFKNVENVAGLFEIRIKMESNIYRIFCCFDEGQLVVLFNGFQKKTQKTPPQEIKKAVVIMNEYFNSKKKGTER